MQQFTNYSKGDAKLVSGPKALVACEYSRTTANRLESLGFYTVSCDILDPDTAGIHYKGDVMDILNDGWDLLIGHPPCTYLAVSGARWLYHPEDKNLPTDQRRPHPKYPNRQKDKQDALDFFLSLYNADIKYVALENPVSMLSSLFRKPDQTIQPYWFGDDAEKKTCLWTKNLPKLTPTNMIEPTRITVKSSGKTYSKWWWDTCIIPTKNGQRSHVRNKSFEGVADAFRDQWGVYVINQLTGESAAKKSESQKQH